MIHDHCWKSWDIVIDTYPETYHRECVICGRIEAQSGDKPWHECFESPTYSEASHDGIDGP